MARLTPWTTQSLKLLVVSYVFWKRTLAVLSPLNVPASFTRSQETSSMASTMKHPHWSRHPGERQALKSSNYSTRKCGIILRNSDCVPRTGKLRHLPLKPITRGTKLLERTRSKSNKRPPNLTSLQYQQHHPQMFAKTRTLSMLIHGNESEAGQVLMRLVWRNWSSQGQNLMPTSILIFQKLLLVLRYATIILGEP